MSTPIDANDPFDLQRFVIAQDQVYTDVMRELRNGRKKSHWIWFIFPQLEELGRSATAKFFGITGLEEAGAYLRHSTLGPRLIECAQAVLAVEGKSAQQILGSPDDLKVRSCCTLFGEVAGANPVFQQVLDKFYKGEKDDKTIKLLSY